jgi:hypothetical protein
METLIIAGIVVAGIVAGTWMWAVLAWASPIQPLILSVVALLVVVGLRTQVRLKLAQSAGQVAGLGEQLKLAPAEIGMGVLCVLLSGLWSVPALRVAALPLAAAQGPLVVSQGLSDGSDAVRVRACELLFEVGGGGSDRHVIQMFEERPVEAQACLVGANKRRPGSVTLTANKAMSGWATRMVSLEDEGKAGEACGLVGPITTMGEIAGESSAHVFAQCAVMAQTQGVRMCCAEQLGEGGTLEKQLGAAGEVPEEVAVAVYGQLTRTMFGTGKGQDAERVAVSKAAGGDRAENRAWAVRQGCAMMKTRGETLLAALQGLVVFVEPASTCRPTDQKIRLSFGKPEMWGFVCEQLQPKRLDQDAEKEVCAAMMRAQVSAAIEEARKARKVARSAMEQERWARSVSSASRKDGYGVKDEDFFTDSQRALAKLGGFKDPSGKTLGPDATWGQMTRGGMSDREMMLRVAREMGVARQMEQYLDKEEGKKMLKEMGPSGSGMRDEPASKVMARAVSLATKGDPSGLHSEKTAERLRGDEKTKPLVTPIKVRSR